jgi:hypothetical protein
MTLIRNASILLMAVALTACSSAATRISDQQNTFDAYPPKVQQKIRAGQIDVGFTQDQVRMAVGEPTRRYMQQTTAGESEVWAYSKSSPTFSFGLGAGTFGSGIGGGAGVGTSTGGNSDDTLRVTFVAGKVTVVERTK